jgi:hypothetical protein
MATQEVHVELLLGRRVYAANGACVGRIEEVVASFDDGECRVDEYHIGAYALLERLAAWHLGRAILGAFRVAGSSYRVRWNQLDLSHPERPCLACSVHELERLT